MHRMQSLTIQDVTTKYYLRKHDYQQPQCEKGIYDRSAKAKSYFMDCAGLFKVGIRAILRNARIPRLGSVGLCRRQFRKQVSISYASIRK